MHLELSPAGRLMRIFGPIVLPSPAVMQVVDAEGEGRRAVGPQIIRDQSLRNGGVFPRRLRISFKRGVLVAPRLDQHIQNLALSIDGPPQIDHPPIDFQIDFVEMSDRMRSRTALAQMRGDHRPKVVHPAAHGLVGDRDPRSASKSSTSRKLSVYRR